METSGDPANMADCLENLNEKLDLVLLEFFEKLETLEDVRNALTNAMRNGFLSMSKARYSMGNKSVGEMQYSRNMRASTLVVERDGCSSKDGVNKAKTDLKGFEVVLEQDKAINENYCPENLAENERPGLRHRSAVKGHLEEMKGEGDDSKREAKFVKEKKATDPLKWFGVLVPTSLKDCQREFKTACRLSGEVVQLERELDRIMTVYAKLKDEKKIFHIQSLDTDK